MASGVHPGFECDRSGMKPIIGTRFHLRGHDFDLCQAEYDKLPSAEKALYEALPPPVPPPLVGTGASVPLVPLALRLLDGVRMLGLAGAATGRPSAFSTWATPLACRGASADLAPTIAFAAAQLKLGASVATGWHSPPLPGILAVTKWPWLGTTPPPMPVVDDPKQASAGGQPTPTAGVPTTVGAPVPTSPGAPAEVLGVVCKSLADPAHQAEVAERAPQASLFTAAVRRDLYAIFRNPAAPGAEPAPAQGDPSAFGVALLGKASVGGGSIDTFAYVDRAVAPTVAGFIIFDDKVLLDSLQHMGQTTPEALAATKAFEHYLAATAKASWTTETIQKLSVEFLVAFAVEMTPRLDINHRVRSCRLTSEEVTTLSSAPFASFVDQGMLRTFQAM